MPNLWVIFTTGLVAGGLTCMAVQGGLLAAALSHDEENHPAVSRVPGVAAFLVAKLFSHTVLGFFLGWFGSIVSLSPRVQAVGIGLVSLFMIGTALSFLDVHPFFRYFVIQPPRFLSRYIRARAKEGGIFAPAFIGLISVAIPCGTTQAMMALAASTASPWWGMMVMAVFIAGTAPLFFLLGISIDAIKATAKQAFGWIAATLIIIMALINLNAALRLYGSTVTIETVLKGAYCTVTYCPDDARYAPSTNPTIVFEAHGYKVDNPVIPHGQDVTVTLKNEAGAGCIQAFTIPALGLSDVVRVGDSTTLSFHAPDEPGTLAFSCSMGMYGGQFIVK